MSHRFCSGCDRIRVTADGRLKPCLHSSEEIPLAGLSGAELRAGVTEYYMYDATNIRLRELAVSYALPQRLMRRTRVFSGMTVSLVARNLFFIYNAAPFDPDLVLSTGNDNQGIDVYGMPTVRSIGFNIKLEF